MSIPVPITAIVLPWAASAPYGQRIDTMGQAASDSKATAGQELAPVPGIFLRSGRATTANNSNLRLQIFRHTAHIEQWRGADNLFRCWGSPHW